MNFPQKFIHFSFYIQNAFYDLLCNEGDFLYSNLYLFSEYYVLKKTVGLISLTITRLKCTYIRKAQYKTFKCVLMSPERGSFNHPCELGVIQDIIFQGGWAVFG